RTHELTSARGRTLRARIKLHDAGRDVVHRAGNPQHAAPFEVREDRAAPADLVDPESDVRPCDGVDELKVFARALAAEVCRLDGRPDSREEARQMSQFHVVDGALDGATGRVPEEEDQLRACDRAREFEAAEQVVGHDVAWDASVEDVADAG